MVFQFEKATRTNSKARVALSGPSGSGKTYTALMAAKALANGGKIAVIDTERGSASLYSDKFDFDVLELETFNPDLFVKGIKAAEDAGYAVIVIDSLSHAWEGEGGVLDIHNAKTKQSTSGNSYVAWADVTPMHRHLIDSVLQSKCHIVATMRAKMEYVQEKNEQTGRTVVRKVGMAPVQRPGIEYEFTMMADLDQDHNIIVSKTRVENYDGKTGHKPDVTWFRPLAEWLLSAKEAPKTMKQTAESLGATVTEQKAEPTKVEKPAVEVAAPMSYELAYSETSEDGTLYGEIETPKLSFMINALMKSLKGDLTPEEREEKARKSDAIRTLLAYRAAEKVG